MIVRRFQKDDEHQLNKVAIEAFSEFEPHYSDWDSLITAVGNMSNLSQTSTIFIAEDNGEVVGGVALVPPSEKTGGHFDPSWASIRMLVVSPTARGKGIGKKLTDICLSEAKHSGTATIALHTSPIMNVALPMYLRMGFTKFKDIDPIFGVNYAVYTKDL